MVTSSYLYSKAFLFSFPDISMLNIETPTRNYISTGGDGWFLTLSTDKLEWNKSHIGSFIFDSHLEYQEYLRFKLFGDKLGLEFVMEYFDTDTSNNVMSSVCVRENVRLSWDCFWTILSRILSVCPTTAPTLPYA